VGEQHTLRGGAAPMTDPAGPPPAGGGVSGDSGAGDGRLEAVRTHLAFGVVLLTAAVGIVRIVLYHWRQGAVLVGGALLLAALLRALLSPRRGGLLVVRGRSVDVLSYTGLGALILFVAFTIQGGPFG
jgi:hypothetical protein